MPRSPVRAAHGPRLRCRGWPQEGLLRLLENTVEIGERPDELVIYGGIGQAARNWDCYDVLVDCLTTLGDDETLVVQSGKPVARFPTSPDAPRVLMSGTQLVGRWATWETFHELRAHGLVMYAQYTAGAWQFIGRQGLLQSTYETLAECARQHFGGTLRGRRVLTSGLGAMGSAQPLAVTLLGGAALVCEVNEAQLKRVLAAGYLDELADDLPSAVARVGDAARAGEPRSVGLLGNAAELLPRLHAAGLRPDVVTDQTPAHDLRFGYVPAGLGVAEAERLAADDPQRRERLALDSIRAHVATMVAFQRGGAVVFEYGNAIRQQAARAGLESANDFEGFVPLFIRPNFCVGRGPCRWVALSGDPQDIRTIDQVMLGAFPGDEAVTGWIRIAMDRVPHQGLPARTAWLDFQQRATFCALVNDLVASGRLAAPVAVSRDHLDGSSVAQPTRETEHMLDGSDPVADWPVLNALLNTAAGATLVALHQGGGGGMGNSISAGVTTVLDGSARIAGKLPRLCRIDPGLGIIRHADAGYPAARAAALATGLDAPMLAAAPRAREPAS